MIFLILCEIEAPRVGDNCPQFIQISFRCFQSLWAMVCLFVHENMIHPQLLRKYRIADQILDFHYSIGLVHGQEKKVQVLHLPMRVI